MRRLLLGLLLLFALPHHAVAQQAIQRAAFGYQGPPRLITATDMQSICPNGCSYPSLVGFGGIGHLLVAIVEGACDPALGDTCNNVHDSKGRVWQKALVVPYNNGTGFFYIIDDALYESQVTVYFSPNTAVSVVLLEYPAVVGLDTTNYATYAQQNGEIGYVNGQSSDWSWTLPLETSSYGELIIAAAGSSGDFGCPFQVGPQFSPEASVGILAIEDMVSGQPSLYFPTLHWTTCAMHWTMGAVAFKMK